MIKTIEIVTKIEPSIKLLNNKNTDKISEKFCILILRLIGGASLLALIFVFVPYSWMNSIHQQLGMGELPNSPIVGYLARSTSAFYTLLGGLFIFLSFDIRKHQNVLIFLSKTIAFLGLILIFIDWFEGMPFFWKIWEGPFVFVLGIVMLFLSRSLKDK